MTLLQVHLLFMLFFFSNVKSAKEIFIKDFIQWSKWSRVVILLNKGNNLSLSEPVKLIRSLSQVWTLTGWAIIPSTEPEETPLSILNVLKTSFQLTSHRLGIIVLLDQNEINRTIHILHLLSEYFYMCSYYSWLLLANSTFRFLINQQLVDNILIGFDSDFSVAYSYQNEELNIYYEVEQIFKIRSNDNSSVFWTNLGNWTMKHNWRTLNGLLYANHMRPENRHNFKDYPLYVGMRNISATFNPTLVNRQQDDDNKEEDPALSELLSALMTTINATAEIIPYAALGWRNEEKAWLHLLGAVTTGHVDLGLDNVIVSYDRATDMSFSPTVAHAMRAVYLVRPESDGADHDLYITPFGPRLLLSVLLTGLFLAGARFSILSVFDGNPHEYSDPLLWVLSVLCMQGNCWQPQRVSGKFVLVIALCFSLVIYNAYAAYITSVLSVRAPAIDSLQALLDAHFKFVYLAGGNDELFLRTANNSALRQLYLRGLVSGYGVPDLPSGLRALGEGHTGLFVSAKVGRHAIKHLEITGRKPCDIQELPIISSQAFQALPMPFHSPYKRLITYGVIRLRETGVLARIQAFLLPPLPSCLPAASTFHSARLSDVRSAFFLLIFGFILSIFILLLEIFWSHRIQKKIKNFLK